MCRQLLVAALMGLVAAWPGEAAAQTLSSGPQVLTFFSTVDDTDQPYAIYVPPNFDATRQYPLVMSLHGAGSNHRLNLRRVFGKSNAEGENDVEATRYFPEWEDVDYIVAAPFARGTMGYQGVAEKDVLDVLADVKRRFPVDPNRVYLTGLSMGGGGALWIGLTRPDIWAAIAPVCPAPPANTMDLAGNALNIPVHLYQGGADPVVSPESVRAWHAAFDSLGTQVEYMEYPGVGHFSWENAYADGQIFDVFDQYERNPHPDRVRFTTRRYKYDTAYWVRIDGLTSGTAARIDAAFAEANQLDVMTSGLDGFTLHLADHPRVEAGQSMDVQINGQSFNVTASDSISFSLRDDAWVAEPFGRGEQAKRPGAEGPISAAVAKRHIYVYGTAGNPSEIEQQARQERAVTAATWSVYRGPFLRRVKVYPRVVADTTVRESDFETSNLVLFGTASTNQIIAQHGDQLPMHLDSTATDTHGLIYTVPLGGKQVLVNSGLPWWQTQDSRGSPFAQQVPAFNLPDEVDYRLYQGRADSVLVEGRFTRSWTVPDAARRALEQSGVLQPLQPAAPERP